MVKMPSLLQGILGRSTASTRSSHVYMGDGVLLMHFQQPAMRKKTVIRI